MISTRFQSTHPHGVRPLTAGAAMPPACFNPRTHMGCDVMQESGTFILQSFNPRTHMGCDSPHFEENMRRCVSIHAPTWGATYKKIKERFTLKVSIHAPTWGATDNALKVISVDRVSIHAPTWGATQVAFNNIRELRGFQSTHPHGVRPLSMRGALSQIEVSIHAPTWGATGFARLGSSEIASFNPRTHMGCDTSASPAPDKPDKFQSTHPHGVRLFALLNIKISIMFQSTHPHGVRQNMLLPNTQKPLFQSTHPHGVRRIILQLIKWPVLFQSTHPHGVRPRINLKARVLRSFNPRTHTGCDKDKVQR